jgi:hypothetical protein
VQIRLARLLLDYLVRHLGPVRHLSHSPVLAQTLNIKRIVLEVVAELLLFSDGQVLVHFTIISLVIMQGVRNYLY